MKITKTLLILLISICLFSITISINLKNSIKEEAKTCPYDEGSALEVLKQLLDILVEKPSNISDATEFSTNKSQCLAFLDSKRSEFSEKLEEFNSKMCAAANDVASSFTSNIITSTVWEKMKFQLVNTKNGKKQCTSVLNVSSKLSDEAKKKVDSLLKSNYSGKFNDIDTSKAPKFIAGNLATRRFSREFQSSSFAKINEASRYATVPNLLKNK